MLFAKPALLTAIARKPSASKQKPKTQNQKDDANKNGENVYGGVYGCLK